MKKAQGCRSGRSGIQALLLGSVSETLVNEAPCPVLLVRSPVAEVSTPPAAPDAVGPHHGAGHTAAPPSGDDSSATDVIDPPRRLR